MRKSIVFLCAVLGVSLAAGDPVAELRKKAEKIQYNTPEDYKFGEEVMQTFSRIAKTRKRVTPHPLFIAQFVPHRVGHLSLTETIWNDRQLFCSRMLWDTKQTDFQISAIRKNFQLMKEAGYDGSCGWFYPGYQRAWVYYLKAALDTDFKILPSAGLSGHYSILPPQIAEAMYTHPAMLRLSGVPLIRSYSADISGDLKHFSAKMEEWHKVTGGKDFKYMTELFLVHARDSMKNRKEYQEPVCVWLQHRKASGKTLLLCYDYIADFLRVSGSGGICFGPYSNSQALKFPAEYYDKWVLPLFGAVLASPEFNGKKLFTANFKCGYSHPAGSQTLSREGTKTLRQNLEMFLKHNVDVLIGSEWDELNEDTCLGPTVVRTTSGPRITRYYSALSRNAKLTPMPGDDLTLPNMIVSQRRELTYGAEFELELLNVPDGTPEQKYTVSLELLDHTGKTVYKKAGMKFNTSKLEDQTLRLNGIDYTKSRLLRPRLTIDMKGKKRILEGLPFTVMRPAVCDDHSWYCTALRNLMQPKKAKVTFARQADSMIQAKAELEFADPLNSVELLRSSYTAAAYDPNKEFEPGAGRLYMLTATKLKPGAEKLVCNVNVPSAVTFSIPADPRQKAVKEKFPFRISVSANFSCKYIFVPQSGIEQAVLSVKGNSVQWEKPLKALRPGEACSKVNSNGIVLALEAAPRPFRMSLPLNVKSLNWQLSVPENMPELSMCVRAVSMNGKVWYSQGFALGKEPQKNEKALLLRGLNEYRGWQSFKLPESRVPRLEYEFNPANGQTLRCGAGREYWAQIGAHAQLASDSNGSRSTHSLGICTPFRAAFKQPGSSSAPEWKTENGRHYLRFDGKSGSFLMFPRTAEPQYSGYHLTMEIRPLDLKRYQTIFCRYTSYQTGFRLYLKRGKLALDAVQRRPQDERSAWLCKPNFQTKLALRANEWNKVELIYDGNTVKLVVNGKSESFKLDGVPRWLGCVGFGGWGKEMFHGDLRKFSIDPALPEK